MIYPFRFLLPLLASLMPAVPAFSQELGEDFFWNEVLPAWKKCRASLSSAEVGVHLVKTNGPGTKAVSSQERYSRLYLKDGMRKVEFGRDTLFAACGDNRESTFTVMRSGLEDASDSLSVIEVGNSIDPEIMGSPLNKELQRLHAGTTIPLTCMTLFYLSQDDPHVKVHAVTKRGENDLLVSLERTENFPYSLDLVLDRRHNWAIRQWRSEKKDWKQVANGVNEFYADSVVGNAFPKKVEWVVFRENLRTEAIRLEFDAPTICNIPDEEFAISHYGFDQVAIPEGGSLPPHIAKHYKSVKRRWFYTKVLKALSLIALVLVVAYGVKKYRNAILST